MDKVLYMQDTIPGEVSAFFGEKRLGEPVDEVAQYLALFGVGLEGFAIYAEEDAACGGASDECEGGTGAEGW